METENGKKQQAEMHCNELGSPQALIFPCSPFHSQLEVRLQDQRHPVSGKKEQRIKVFNTFGQKRGVRDELWAP